MVDETTTTSAVDKAQNNEKFRERFEIVLSVNGFIVCQRYFKINGFNPKSTKSMEIVSCIDECVNLIKDDLRNKSNLYNWYTAPYVYENKEEMTKMIAKGHLANADVPSYVVLRDDETIYVWNGTDVEVNPKNINRLDYVKGDETQQKPCLLKFSFLDRGREVISKAWDGNVYPRFVRANIDLCNRTNKYKEEGIFAPFESGLIDVYIKELTDLVPTIINNITETCSVHSEDGEEEYTTIVNYGNRTYNLDYRQTRNRMIRQLEQKYKKKTEAYFKSIGYNPKERN